MHVSDVIKPDATYPAFLKRCQCCSCAEAKRRSILILQVQADKADAVLAPLPQGEPVVSNGDYTLCTQMNCKIWCNNSLFSRSQ